MKKTLLFDANSIYNFMYCKSYENELRAYIAKENIEKVGLPPLILCEIISKIQKNPDLFQNCVKGAMTKFNNFSPCSVIDQDKLFDAVKNYLCKKVKDEETFENAFFNADIQWYDIQKNLPKASVDNVNLSFNEKGNNKQYKINVVTCARNDWENEYVESWKWMDENVDKDPSILENEKWDKIEKNIFCHRANISDSDIEDVSNVAKFMKYMSEEYKAIWKKKIENPDYQPAGKKHKNDYDDMHLVLYAALDNVYVLTNDKNMIDLSSAYKDGKVIYFKDVFPESAKELDRCTQRNNLFSYMRKEKKKMTLDEISVYLDGKVDSTFNRKAFFEELNQDYRFVFSHGKYACVNAQK